MSQIEKRKQRHVKISLQENVETNISTGFEDICLIHRSLPEIDLSDIKLKTKLFGKTLEAPLIISAITGGNDELKKINQTLAKVAEKTGIGIGVGSQRIAIEQPDVSSSFSIVREMAPTVLVIGNIGCPQLSLGWGFEEGKKAVEMLEADALAIHMNPLQEAIQINGDTKYRGLLKKINEISDELVTPIIMKETGAGISKEDAVKIEESGAKGLDISGVGGTSWSAVEYHIAKELKKNQQEYLGKALWNWGIPTAISVIESRETTNLKIIASGGIRNGTEIAKSLVLGADAAGMAKPLLQKAMEGEEKLEEYINNIIQELRVVMFLLGAENITELRRVPALIFGKTAEWLQLRGFDPKKFAKNI
jgi:isopentenyl-diphosphate delta-isomerase